MKNKYSINIRETGKGFDSLDLFYLDEDKKVIGSGFIPKEGDRAGKKCLIRCPECRKENYAGAVLSGGCAWCDFDANGEQE